MNWNTDTREWERVRRELRDSQERSNPSDGPFVDIELTSPTAWRKHAEQYRAVAEVVMNEKTRLIAHNQGKSQAESDLLGADTDPILRGAAEYQLLGQAVELMLKAT